jgi:hypothetical protein
MDDRRLASSLVRAVRPSHGASLYARSGRVTVARVRRVPCVANGSYEMTSLTGKCSLDGRGLCGFSCDAQPSVNEGVETYDHAGRS